MTAFTLYGARGSTNTDRVRLTLAEGGFTDYKLELLNLQKGEQKVCTNVGICIGIYFTANTVRHRKRRWVGHMLSITVRI